MNEESLAHYSKTLQKISHRGPDDVAQVSGEDWWMGFRRLAILDLSLDGRQPMTFGSGRYQLTFNGEIYNFKELRHELSTDVLKSSGDTAVLGSLLSVQSARQVLSKLRGMFAFAWYDTEEKQLLLARDHFGIKPLYYCQKADGSLFYGSELRAVATLAKMPMNLSKTALADYLRWGTVQAPHTMIEGVECLPPGHCLHWEAGQVKIGRYFTPEWPLSSALEMSWGEQVAQTRETVLDSVQAHLVSDVPVGVFLSGGLDSSLIAASMKHLGVGNVQAFSIGYEVGAGVPDESDTAQRTAEFLGCNFYSEKLNAASVFSKLDGYFGCLDQPTGDALNTYLVSELAARVVKVTLSGLGADEWFAGYNYHRLIALAQHSPLAKKPLNLALGGLMGWLNSKLPSQMCGHAGWKAGMYLMGGAGGDLADQHAYGRRILHDDSIQDLLRNAPPSEELTGINHAEWLKELLLRETAGYLPNTLLRDNDSMSMAHSLELRVPLVDKEVFQLAGRLPGEAKLSLKQGKRVLRAAFKDLLPPWIFEDKQKKTFTLPLMKWMREPQWQERIRATLASEASSMFDSQAVSKICEQYFSKKMHTKAAWHLSQPVWMLFVLCEWQQKMRGVVGA